MRIIPKRFVTKNIQMVGIVVTIIAAFIGAGMGVVGSDLLWQKQVDYQNHNVAKALQIEIQLMKDEVDFNANQFKPALIPRSFTPRPISQKFYSDKGLYFSFQKEIASFNPKLSEPLFIYYNDLVTAEYLRGVANEKSKIITNHPNYQTRLVRNINDLNDVESSNFVKKFNVDSNEMKMIIWEGYDPNLSDEENVEIAQGRAATARLIQLLVNASEMQPRILSELDKEINE